MRPTFLVAEPEPEQALSTRKILLETFKFNVITAHSQTELLGLLDQFPNVNAVIVHSDTPGERNGELIGTVKEKAPNLQVIVLSPDGTQPWAHADHQVNSHSPEDLLHLLQSLFGDARRLDMPSDRQGAE